MPHHSIPKTTEETTEIPEGYCQCGCGQRTMRRYSTSTREGYRKGDFSRFVKGHSSRQRLQPVQIDRHEGVVRIPLNHHRRHGLYTVVDIADLDLVGPFVWTLYLNGGGLYARTRLPEGDVPLHRLIMAPGDGRIVDHINGDGLDNRRCNLRIANHARNQMNRPKSAVSTSGYKGVFLRSDGKKWRAQITANKRVKHLGSFDNAEEAARAYDDAARELHGDFACVNFPRPGERSAR